MVSYQQLRIEERLMSNKTVKIILGAFLALALLGGSFSAGVLTGWLLPDPIGRSAAPQPVAQATEVPAATTAPQESSAGGPDAIAQATPDLSSELFAPYMEAWDLIHQMYVDQPVNDQALVEGSIKGMVDALGDTHTTYLTADQLRQMNQSLAGEYSGIGAWVDATKDYLQIISAMPNSPAEKAGLRGGDQIIAVDGKDMTGIDGETVLSKVIGAAGTPVTLTIKREGQDPFDVTLTRAKITVPAVEGEMKDNNIAYIHIYSFGDNTTAQLRSTLRDLLAQKPAGLVLDLRDNGGGYLQSAIEVASEFIPNGTIAFEQYGDGTRETLSAQRGGQATDIPMVVLINGSTASASEIVAGAIQDRGRGQLVGETSYGKGSVQQTIPMKTGDSAIKVTVARWLTPDGRQINGVGLTPDVAVALTQADIDAGRDPQLDQAIRVLQETIAQPAN
jgi:carboxyl-terminal processing protease